MRRRLVSYRIMPNVGIGVMYRHVWIIEWMLRERAFPAGSAYGVLGTHALFLEAGSDQAGPTLAELRGKLRSPSP